MFVFAGSVERLSDVKVGPHPEVFEQHGTRHATEAEARAAFEQEVAVQERFKWQKTERTQLTADGPPDPGLAPAAEDATLEAAAAASADGARVYADWLQSRSDPRGTLAALLQAGKAEQAEAFLAANANLLLGDLDVSWGGAISQPVWRHGLLAEATLKVRQDWGELAALTGAFLRLPLARFLTGLHFGLAHFESNNDWTATLAAVIGSPRREQITGLWFDEYGIEDCEISWTPFGDFSAIWAGLPALETLHLRSGAGGELGRIRAPRLKTFIRESGGLGRAEIDAIVGADWPQLERLDVWFGREEYGAQGTAGSVARILDGQTAGAVTHLGLVNCEFSPELVPPLTTSRILPRLKVLDLSKGVLVDADADRIVAHAGAFAHLQRLDLSENLLTPEGEARVKAALPNAVLGGQRWGDSDEGEYRYAAVGE